MSDLFKGAIRALYDVFSDAGYELYLVGGAVRDLALGATVDDLDDLDFATNARPQQTLKLLKAGRYRTYEMGIEFGTVGAVLKGPRARGFPKDVQITTYRSGEYYRRGSRHPVVQFGDTLAQDLKRRDFSINSIAMDANGAYVDPYDGLGDIKRRVLRIVGDPDETLAEDPLRILRVGRFMAKLGFEPTEELERAAWRQAAYILDISRQRWLQEMNKLVVGPHVDGALAFLARVRLLGLILPEVAALVDLHRRSPGGPVHPDLWERTRRRVAAAGDQRALSWAALLADIGRPWTRMVSGPGLTPEGAALAGLSPEPSPSAPVAGAEVSFERHAVLARLLFKGITRRFHFDNDSAEQIEHLLEHQDAALAYHDGRDDAWIRAFVRDMKEHRDGLIAMGRCLQETDRRGVGVDLDRFSARIEALAASGALVPRLPKGLGTAIIKQLGVTPGPGLGDVIDWLTEEIIAGRLESDQEVGAYVQFLREVSPEVLDEARQGAGPSQHGKPGLE